jgi:hypothetical protein
MLLALDLRWPNTRAPPENLEISALITYAEGETMTKRTVATLIALAWLLMTGPQASAAGVAQQLAQGWNFVRANNCYGQNINGVDTLYVYPTTGGFLETTDGVVITSIAPLCASGDGFYVYISGNVWVAISIYASIK